MYRNTRADPASAVFATTSREHPIHLWDAYTGQIRCVAVVIGVGLRACRTPLAYVNA